MSNEAYRTAGQKIREARIAAGLTQTELAEATHTTQGHISGLERGWHSGRPSYPKVATLKRLAVALKCPWYELVL
ncbi:MAG: helix-turn-helix transcriptional regulator [Planctomycetota bacterium]|nr:helix-turn-helix transcriptional regulator [Planctomycetota bacterium]